MKFEVNWQKLLIEVIKAIVYALAGGAAGQALL